jgi:hypothetical protein
MGEYEDRYPESYGRGDDDKPSLGKEPAEVLRPAPASHLAEATPARRVPFAPAPESAPQWKHVPEEALRVRARPPEPYATRTIEPVHDRYAGTFRGIGPRGYVRSPQRIYEDICDRLTDNPFIDASDIEVTVSGSEAVLRGSVDSEIARRQCGSIADEVAGVTHVHNRLTVRANAEQGEAPPRDLVNRMGSDPLR